MQFQIHSAKNQTIARLLNENFPVLNLKRFDNEKLALISPQTVAYIDALIIDSISIGTKKSINALALDHKSSMLDAYDTEMPTDTSKLQLQAWLSSCIVYLRDGPRKKN